MGHNRNSSKIRYRNSIDKEAKTISALKNWNLAFSKLFQISPDSKVIASKSRQIELAKESKRGLMDQSMKAGSLTIKRMVAED